MPIPWQVQFVQTHHGIALDSLLEFQNCITNDKSFADGSQTTMGIPNVVNRCNNIRPCQEERRPTNMGKKYRSRLWQSGAHMIKTKFPKFIWQQLSIQGTCNHIRAKTKFAISVEVIYG
jgi:hypothetical protein